MPAKFKKVHIEISSICNLQCSFCPEVVREKKVMDPELFRLAIRQVAPITEQVALHLMGDPLVHPRLPEIVDLCEAFAVPIFLVTNGTLLREKSSALLLRPIFRQVNFSLHSFPDNFPDRDPGDYLEKIFSWTEQAFLERPDLYINYRIWNLQSTTAHRDLNRDILQRIQERFGTNLDLNLDLRVQKSRRIKNRLYLHFDTEFVWPSLDLPKLGNSGTCYGLGSHFGILVDGTVVPCCLDKEGVVALGRIQDSPLKEILDSPRARAMLEGFRRRVLVENLCQHCQYIERFSSF